MGLNILVTDGFENSSKTTDEATLRNLIQEVNAYNLIIACGWAEVKKLKSLASLTVKWLCMILLQRKLRVIPS